MTAGHAYTCHGNVMRAVSAHDANSYLGAAVLADAGAKALETLEYRVAARVNSLAAAGIAYKWREPLARIYETDAVQRAEIVASLCLLSSVRA